MAESKPIEVTVSYEGRTFPFQLHRRQLTFGAAGQGDYYWMDGRQLRRGQGGPNFRPCVDLWWHAVENAGDTRVVENELTLVLAECYPLVNTAKSLQEVFVDAHLYNSADREYSIQMEAGVQVYRSDRTFMLPDEECARLYELAHSRRTEQVGQELDRLFLGWLPDVDVLGAYQESARAWIGNGIHALRTGGREGLRRYTGELDSWIHRFRRRAGHEHVRHFINIFSYASKVAFYLCYANAWVALLPRLEQLYGPNIVGRRFMEMWHHQNRIDRDANGIPQDVFRGQVLALHPLSAVVLTAPEHLTVIGKWVGHLEYDQLHAEGRIGECPEHWDVVATILIAAHEYSASRERWELNRGSKPVTSTAAIQDKTRDDATASAAVLFEDFAQKRGMACPACAAPLRHDRYEPDPDLQETVIAHYVCSRCERTHFVQVSYEELQNDDKDS